MLIHVITITMDFIQGELNKEFSAIGFKNQRRHLKLGKQIGKTDKNIDSKRKALLPGKRRSKNPRVGSPYKPGGSYQIGERTYIADKGGSLIRQFPGEPS